MAYMCAETVQLSAVIVHMLYFVHIQNVAITPYMW